MNNYTIGQVSKIVGLSAKTIRFYEESGVITPANRKENGYRSYPEKAIEELKVLKYARDLGLPLSEIKKLMKGCEDGGCQHPKQYVEESIDNYLGLLTKKIQQLNLLRTRLNGLKKTLVINEENCDKDAFYCNILQQLIDVTSKKGGEKNGSLLLNKKRVP